MEKRDNMIALDLQECAIVYGGRNEDIAYFIEKIAQCVGAFARLIYIANKRTAWCLVTQAESGEYPKW